MQIYLMKQIAFSHPTSNNMVYVSTFLCPRRLFSPSKAEESWLPQPRQATKLSLFQPPGVYKEPEMGQNHQSHLLCCLDNTSSPRPDFTYNSAAVPGCAMPRSQERACKCTVDFLLQVISPLKNVLANAPLTFHRKSTSPLKNVLANAKRTCSQMHRWLSFASHHPADFIPFRKACHCGTSLSLWYSHPALASLILQQGATHPAAQDTHCGLDFAFFVAQYPLGYCLLVPHVVLERAGINSFLSFLWRKFSAQLSRSLPSGATFIKNIVYTFLSSC